MWLADPTSRDMLDGIRNAMEEKNYPIVWFQPEWAAPDECWIVEVIEATIIPPELGEKATNCWEKHQAIYKMGQIPPAA